MGRGWGWAQPVHLSGAETIPSAVQLHARATDLGRVRVRARDRARVRVRARARVRVREQHGVRVVGCVWWGACGCRRHIAGGARAAAGRGCRARRVRPQGGGACGCRAGCVRLQGGGACGCRAGRVRLQGGARAVAGRGRVRLQGGVALLPCARSVGGGGAKVEGGGRRAVAGCRRATRRPG